MGFIPDPHEIQHKYKLTTNYRTDAINEDEIAQQMNQMNQSLAEMVQAIQELNTQLEEYVRSLNDSIGRFRQMLQPENNQSTAGLRAEEALVRIRVMMEDIQREETERIQQQQRMQERQNNEHSENHRAELEPRQRNNMQQGDPQHKSSNQQRVGFLSRTFNFVLTGARNIFEMVVFSG